MNGIDPDYREARDIDNLAYHLPFYGGMCGRAVNTSNSRSRGSGFKPRPSGCFLTQRTLLHFVSLHPGV